jgi:two-component system response regulator AtoC
MPTIQDRILLVDPSPEFRARVREVLARLFPQFPVLEAGTGEAGWQALRQSAARLVYCSCELPDLDGLELLHRIRMRGLPTLVVAMGEAPEVSRVVECVKAGAFEFLARPFSAERLIQITQAALEHLRASRVLLTLAEELRGEELFWGESPAMREVVELIKQVAPTSTTVLISGESGTGKELAAREIHRRSRRSEQPLVVINCGAIPAGLVESELFGHTAGAFTGAQADKAGLLEEADLGTVLLDEIGEFPLDLQVKVLRVLQDGEVRRLGSDRTRRLDLRVLAATNRDLEAEVAAGRFRKDLYYRLNVVRLHLPPLRERKEELSLLVSHFLNKYRAEYRHQIQGISRGALAMFQNYDWPGNIRELEHALLQIMVLHGEKPVIEEGDLPLFLERRSPEHKRRFQQDALEVQLSLDDYAREFVRMFESQSTERELAQALGVTPKTLWQKRQKWNLKRRSRTGKDHPG